MSKSKIDHNLIEYVLTLLCLPANHNIGTDDLIENGELAIASTAANSQGLQTAYEVIKFMDEMPGGFLIYRADGDEEIIYANKALLRIFQCDTLSEFRELTGNSFKGLVYHEDLEAIEQSIQEQITDSQYDLDYVEYRIIRKDGSIRWVEDYGHFIQSESLGGIFYVFIGDATKKRERHLTEKANLINEKKQLIEKYDQERSLINQEHLRRLEVIEGLGMNYESILYADLDANKILPYRLSSRIECLFDKKYEERDLDWYISAYIENWVHPEDREMLSALTIPGYIQEKLSVNPTYYMNFRILHDEDSQYMQLYLANVGNKEHISQVVMGYRLVDEEIQHEMKQKELLEEALKNANLAITAKNTFLSNMSHDMRTPLNAISGYLDLAKKHIVDCNAVQNYLDKIEESSKQLLDVIDKVLEISWMESDDIRITEAECDLCDVMQEVHDMIRPLAEKKKIHLSLDMTKLEHGNVYSDQEKLRQTLLYLGNNAVKYTQQGGKISLSVSELEKLPNDYAVYQFIVKDNGIGISKDFLEHVFEPFEREKNTTFSGVYGTGLGLAIAKNLTERLGGHIEVNSTVGKGSAFAVTLRLRIHDQPISAPVNADEIMIKLREQKILLVEDNEINLEIETEILKGLGFRVETAENGSIAVEKMKNASPGEFGLILMDIQMPIMDGRKAAEEIRKLENTELAQIPIIALSADAFESDKRRSIESGMNAHMTKPVNIPLLMETITNTLQTYYKLYEK